MGDEVTDRFCVLGAADEHIAKLRELAAAGVDQFNLYLMNGDEEAQVEAYGRDIIPALRSVRDQPVTADDLAGTVAAQVAAAEAAWLAGWLAGPTRTRWTSLPVQVGDPAPDLELADSTGARRRLSDAWASGPAVLIFLRHFGCSCLRERWESLEPALGAISDAGATVHLIGQART